MVWLGATLGAGQQDEDMTTDWIIPSTSMALRLIVCSPCPPSLLLLLLLLLLTVYHIVVLDKTLVGSLIRVLEKINTRGLASPPSYHSRSLLKQCHHYHHNAVPHPLTDPQRSVQMR
jgi:hypothetical protein